MIAIAFPFICMRRIVSSHSSSAEGGKCRTGGSSSSTLLHGTTLQSPQKSTPFSDENYGVSTLHIPRHSLLLLLCVAILFMALATPVSALCADLFGRRQFIEGPSCKPRSAEHERRPFLGWLRGVGAGEIFITAAAEITRANDSRPK